MPFVEQEPRPFTKEDVSTLEYDLLGVYGIFNDEKWIYVGMGDIKDRLQKHLNGDKLCIIFENPKYWVGEILDDEETAHDREKELIIELDPECNDRIG